MTTRPRRGGQERPALPPRRRNRRRTSSRSVPFVKRHHTKPTTKPTLQCPGPVGGSQYSPLAYSPETEAVYVSGIELCFYLMSNTNRRQRRESLRRRPRRRPGRRKDRHLHRRHASTTARSSGRRRCRPRWSAAPPPRAGGLVFTGDQKGVLYGFDARDRQDLYEGNLGLGLRLGAGDLLDRRHRVRARDDRRRRPHRLRRTWPVGAEVVALKLVANRCRVAVRRRGKARLSHRPSPPK